MHFAHILHTTHIIFNINLINQSEKILRKFKIPSV